jgi:hypothetical protein
MDLNEQLNIIKMPKQDQRVLLSLNGNKTGMTYKELHFKSKTDYPMVLSVLNKYKKYLEVRENPGNFRKAVKVVQFATGKDLSSIIKDIVYNSF